MTPTYIAQARDVERQMYEAEGKTDAGADKQVAEMKASFDRKKMVGNVRQMAALLAASVVQTKFIEFPDEDHFSVVPSARGRAVPFAVGDKLPAR